MSLPPSSLSLAQEAFLETIRLKGLHSDERARLIPLGTVLLGYRGSIAHGMYRNPEHHPEAIDDKDLVGACIAPLDVYMGLARFEQQETKLREWDSVVYEYRKLARLLAQGNPNVLSLLWLEPHFYIYAADEGRLLVENRRLFATRSVYHAFTGYAYGQLKRMTHLAFEGYMGEKRKALVQQFGYDTKNAAHLIRLLRMGIEFLREGELHVLRPDAPQLMEIKLGHWTLEQIKAEADHLFKRAQAAYDECKLPDRPDTAAIGALVRDAVWDYHARIKNSGGHY